jgi:hypothetical protein
MPSDQKRPDADQQPRQDDREKTLTEKEEDEEGGANKQTPGPVYDV